MARTSRTPPAKLGHDRVLTLALSELRPSPENDLLYRPIQPEDPEILALADSIRQHGVREPLVITEDRYILSGHRRFAAAQLADLESVPVRIEPIRRADAPDQFLILLREYNRQREKSRDERLREEILTVDPDDAYESLIEHRRSQSEVATAAFSIRGTKSRCEISAAKGPFLAAILEVLDERRDFWPLSDRAIHYALLNHPPLKHASKSHSRYDNTKSSYKALTELLTRARLAGAIPMTAIADETRPVTTWTVHRESGLFIREELHQFLKGYSRDLLQSQPNHLEIVCEKNTVEPIVRSVAMEYCVPLTSGRGYCSLPPRHAIAQRYLRSGKQSLILLLLSDFDPDGEEIAHSLARSLRDDFEIENIHPIKVALTAEQVEEHELPPQMEAKESSAHYRKFVDLHGQHVFELEALPPATLQQILRDAIDGVLDIEAFNAELDAERNDAQFLAGVRTTVQQTLAGVDLGLAEADDEETDE